MYQDLLLPDCSSAIYGSLTQQPSARCHRRGSKVQRGGARGHGGAGGHRLESPRRALQRNRNLPCPLSCQCRIQILFHLCRSPPLRPQRPRTSHRRLACVSQYGTFCPEAAPTPRIGGPARSQTSRRAKAERANTRSISCMMTMAQKFHPPILTKTSRS